MDTSTIYWIVGIAAVIFLGFTHICALLIGKFMDKRFGAVVGRDLISGRVSHVDFESMKEAKIAGTMLIQRRYGPFGILSEWMTIPDPFVVRDREGKPEKLYWPKELFVDHVTGRVEVEAGEMAKLAMEAGEWKTKAHILAAENQGHVDAGVKRRVKDMNEANPFNNQANMKGRNVRAGRGGGLDGYNQ